MYAFFHGWRRKAGCVTLAMAMLLFCLWVRSHIICDRLGLLAHHRQHDLVSFNSRVYYWSFNHPGDGDFWVFQSSMSEHREEVLEANRVFWEDCDVTFKQFVLPYQTVLLPISLLSAYLILWNPRKRAAP